MASTTTDHLKSEAQSETAEDFETAIAKAGFGWYNIALLLVALPAAIATVFETTTISYILPIAECDLKLTLLDKGKLNGMPYAGIITSSLAWGFIADTQGRKKILVYGYLANGFCVLGGAISQSIGQLMVFKYLGGFIIAGPFAVLMSYLTELHGKEYRGRVMMSVGIMMTLATLILPAMGLVILRLEWYTEFFGLRFHVWQLYIALSAVPALLSSLLFSFFPESPKFLMSQGNNAEALKIFRKIYAFNKRQPESSYPIKSLAEETNVKECDVKRNLLQTIYLGLKQLSPLFRKPYLALSIRVYLMNFCILVGHSTVTLWMPQLFTSISEYQQKYPGSTSLCDVVNYSVNKTAFVELDAIADNCEVIITSASYTNNIVVATTAMIGYITAAFLINVVGDKWILNTALVVAGICGMSLYWSSTALSTLIISAILVTMGNIATQTVINASVNLFPTLLRTIIVSLASMFGRCGSLLGNVIFPMLMEIGCVPPFILISSVMFCAGFMSLFLPNTKKLSLK